MQSKAHPTSHVICHPVYCLTSAGIVDMSRQSDRRADREASSGQGDEPGESIARPAIWATYASFVRKAVMFVTLARRRPRLDPAVGALRDTGLFVRPHPPRWRDDEAGDRGSQFVPTPVVTDPSR